MAEKKDEKSKPWGENAVGAAGNALCSNNLHASIETNNNSLESNNNSIETNNKPYYKKIFFPYDSVRCEQDKMINDIFEAIAHKKNIVVHAPTGLGKTAAALSPALSYAIENGLRVFFLTSRHTQHKIAVETLKKIKDKYSASGNFHLSAVDIIGKKWMCGIEGAHSFYSGEFVEYCRSMREKSKCSCYLNTRKSSKLTVEAKKLIEDVSAGIFSSEEIIDYASKSSLCPYEIAIELAKRSMVVVADYYYVFNPMISEMFFSKINSSLGESILIVDEAHNLPERMRALATQRLTNIILKRAIKEAKRYNCSETLGNLVLVQDVLNDLVCELNKKIGKACHEAGSRGYQSNNYAKKEIKVRKEDFIAKVADIKDYDELIADFESAAQSVREKQKRSFIGSIGRFLDVWKGSDDGFTRIFSIEETKDGTFVTLSYKCLDPSVVCSSVIDEAYSTVMMSGTLTPTFMYKDLLGVENCVEKEYASPFPDKNRLNIIVPRTTTRFAMRSAEQYEKIGRISADIANRIKGNVFVFFPSYQIRDKVYLYFMKECGKTIFLEDQKMGKEQRIELLEDFKKHKKAGAVLLGVASGSFGEGVDLPGTFLNGVIVVGLPLCAPDLETRELIDYFDRKYMKGWDYGYKFPAFQKCLQNAGRCIRSENDRGVVVFLDERFVWHSYKSCFPDTWNIVVTNDYVDIISDFFTQE